MKTAAARKVRFALINVALALFVLAVAVASYYKLRVTFHDFDTVAVGDGAAADEDSRGRRLDRILMDELRAFGYIHSFDHVLGQKPFVHHLNTIWADRCEVRQEDFYKFAKWFRLHQPQGIAAPDQPNGWIYDSSSREHKVSGRLKAPANGVGYYDAYAYCRAAGGRLPTRREWMAMAGGTEGRLYPWGDDFRADGWPYLDARLNAAQRCGVHPDLDTPRQLHDMGANVSEWAEGDDGEPRPSIHGGNAFNRPYSIYSLNALYRHAPPSYRSPYVGFRCVYDEAPRQPAWSQRAPLAARISPGAHPLGLPRDARVPGLLSGLSREQLEVIEGLLGRDRRRGTFRILRHEVTRAQYRRFLDDPIARFGFYANENEPKDHDYRPTDWSPAQDDGRLPATGLDWWSAYAFARWSGGRLPSADEWNAAASWNGRYVYPWGNHYEKERAVAAEDLLTTPLPALENRGDVTPHGAILHLGGNVSEWTRSIGVHGNGYAVVVKGGSYSLPGKETARIDFENRAPASYRSPRIGFRVVFDGES